MIPKTATLLDLVERAAATFAQAFLATITVDATGVAQVEALKVGVVAGAFSVAKFALVKVNTYLSVASAPPPPAVVAPPPENFSDGTNAGPMPPPEMPPV